MGYKRHTPRQLRAAIDTPKPPAKQGIDRSRANRPVQSAADLGRAQRRARVEAQQIATPRVPARPGGSVGGAFSSEAVNIMPDGRLTGGAESDAARNFPPDGWSWGFRTALAVPTIISKGQSWDINPTRDPSARMFLQKDVSVADLGIQAGDTVRFLANVHNPYPGNYSAAISWSGGSGYTIVGSDRIAVGQARRDVYVDVRFNEPTASVGLRIGVGTTAVNASNLRVSDIRAFVIES